MAVWRRGVGRDGVSRAAVDREAVAQLAYELYEQRGKASGRELDDWLKAEAILRQGGGSGRVGRAVTAKQAELRGE